MHYYFLRFFNKKRKRLKNSSHRNLVHTITNSCLILSVLFAVHITCMVHYEGLSVGDATWLTFTTATTVGYGDMSAASTEGRLATILLLYLGGIFIFAKVVGDYFDYRLELRDKKHKGLWNWNMNNHIVILNTPSHAGERYLERLIKQFRLSDKYANTPIYLLTRQFSQGLPHFISQLGDVVHYHGSASNPHDLAAVHVEKACDIIVLAKDEGDEASDGRTFDILHRLDDLKVSATILAECVEDASKQRLLTAGANKVIRPMRAYPEMIVRAFVTPGSELIIENMFNSDNDEYRRYDVEINQLAWSDVVSRLIKHNVGVAVAYIDRATQQLVYNPSAETVLDAQAIITISKESSRYSNEEIKALVTKET